MKLIIAILFLICLPLYGQDSTLIKDRIDIDKNYQAIQTSIQELQISAYQLEGAIGYVQTLDSSLDKSKQDYNKLAEEYSKIKTKITELQIQLYILQGYREYNQLLQHRKQ